MGQAVAYESLGKRNILIDEIRDMERQANRMDREVSSGLIDSASFSHSRLNDKDGFLAKLASKKKQLALITPPSLEELKNRGVSEDNLRKRREQLAKFIVMPIGKFPRMRSQEEMDRAPAGSDDLNKLYHRKIAHHNIDKAGNLIAVDHSKSQYPGYVEYKNLCRILSSSEGSEEEMDNSVANLEMLRPPRVNDNESMFASRTFTPASRLTAQEYEDRIGIESLNPIQLAIHELEKKGAMKAPSMGEHYERMFGDGGDKVVTEAKVADAKVAESDGDEPLHVGANNWVLPNGDPFRGSRKEAKERWAEVKGD